MGYICSECGKEICILAPQQYKYKTNNYGYHKSKKDNSDVKFTSDLYQCSYTCYDHALLRNPREQSNMSMENFKEAVLKSENAMKAQGKKILHPIIIKDKKMKRDR